MSFTAVNPVPFGPAEDCFEQPQDWLAEDSKTWKKGEFGYLTSGTVTPVSTTGKTDVFCQFCEDQDSATSTSSVKIRRLKPGGKWVMFVQKDGTASAVGASNKGVKYGAESISASNVTYLDLGTSSGQFQVVSLASEIWPTRHGASDSPGVAICEFGAVS